jgi:hypothetical protein
VSDVPQPPADALVVRGGSSRDATAVREKVLAAVEDGDGPVLSVYVDRPGPAESPGECLARICSQAKIPHRKVQVSTVAQLIGAGFTVVHSVSEGEPSSHHHVHFVDRPIVEQWVQDFIECFAEPVANPTGGKVRRRS